MNESREYEEPKREYEEGRFSFDSDPRRGDERSDEDEVPFYIPRD